MVDLTETKNSRPFHTRGGGGGRAFCSARVDDPDGLTDEEPARGARTAIEPPAAAAALRRRPAAAVVRGRRAQHRRGRSVARGRVPSAAPAPVAGRRTLLLLLPAVFPVTVQAPGHGGVGGRRPVVVGRGVHWRAGKKPERKKRRGDAFGRAVRNGRNVCVWNPRFD